MTTIPPHAAPGADAAPTAEPDTGSAGAGTESAGVDTRTAGADAAGADAAGADTTGADTTATATAPTPTRPDDTRPDQPGPGDTAATATAPTPTRPDDPRSDDTRPEGTRPDDTRVARTRSVPTRGAAVPRGPDDRLVVAYGRASGISGLLFAVLFVCALGLLHRGPALAAPDPAYTAFYDRDGGKALVVAGLYLVPFAGIAFLWHLAATRAFFGVYRRTTPVIPRFLQQASGVAFVCLVFAGTAAFGTVALLSEFQSPIPPPEVARPLAGLGYGLMFVYAVRFAGMYLITSITLARKVGVMPRRLAVLGYVAAAFLLLNTTFHPAVLLVFPAWVITASVVALVHAHRASPAASDRGEHQP